MSLPASVDLDSASRGLWDVLVVGAGPAGALAALELARWQLAVLLVDQSEFPRSKVCGSCLNGRALALLADSGLGDLPAQRGAVPLDRVVLGARHARATIPWPGGVSLSRHALDVGLIEAAIDAGASFLPATRAVPGPLASEARAVSLQHDGRQVAVQARVVLVAAGLAGSTWDAAAPVTSSSSRIGAGALLDGGPADYQPGTVYLGCGTHGYVGIVRVENGHLDVACALAPSAVRSAGPAELARQILDEAGLPQVPGLECASWRGTPTLTRHALRLADTRLFRIGDAAGYVEPFTGEGIAWALASARAVVPLVVRGVKSWQPTLASEWAHVYRRGVVGRRFLCRTLAAILRRPTASAALVAVLARVPALAAPVVRRLCLPDRGAPPPRFTRPPFTQSSLRTTRHETLSRGIAL